MDLGAMLVIGVLHTLRSPEDERHHQMLVWVITLTPFYCGGGVLTPLSANSKPCLPWEYLFDIQDLGVFLFYVSSNTNVWFELDITSSSRLHLFLLKKIPRTAKKNSKLPKMNMQGWSGTLTKISNSKEKSRQRPKFCNILQRVCYISWPKQVKSWKGPSVLIVDVWHIVRWFTSCIIWNMYR